MSTAQLTHRDHDTLGQPTKAQALQFYAFAIASVALFVLLVASILLRPAA